MNDNFIKAKCNCSDEPIVAIKVGVLDNWGWIAWVINIGLVIVTGTIWLCVLTGYVVSKICLCEPEYKCLYCGQYIDPKNYLIES